MKEIGDRLRSCPKGVCRVNNFGKITEKVLKENNTVGLTVSTKYRPINDVYDIRSYACYMHRY